MKTLVFSDTHIKGDFDTKKFNFLQKIIKNSDQVIIGGDFWDGYYVTFEKFVNSGWKNLFPLLKRKKAIYLFGNHDRKEFMDERVSLFSTKATKKYTFKSGKKKFIAIHGDSIISRGILNTFGIEKKSKKFENYQNLDTTKSLKHIPSKITHNIEETGNKFFGNKFSKIFFHRHISNKKLIKYADQKMGKNEILVCGHTHHPENRIDQHYVNTGYIRFGFATYLLIENGKVELIKTSY